jgi:chorismate mutase-like protein
MPAAQDSLDDLRREIDQIDTEIHDLLMRRTAIAEQVGVVKGQSTMFMRPGREARILRRLVARHRGSLPKPVVVQIWREIISALTALEGPYTVAAHAPAGGEDLRRLARQHYGCERPITSHESVSGVLRAVTEGQATLGLLPVPKGDNAEPWWRGLARDGADVPRIVARLPFVSLSATLNNDLEALVVALVAQEVSGDDRSYLVLESDQPMSRSALQKLLSRAGLESLNIETRDDAPDRRTYLVEVDDYVAPDDPRLERLLREGEETVGQCRVIGGYAVPLGAAELESVAEFGSDKDSG